MMKFKIRVGDIIIIHSKNAEFIQWYDADGNECEPTPVGVEVRNIKLKRNPRTGKKEKLYVFNEFLSIFKSELEDCIVSVRKFNNKYVYDIER